MTWEGARRNEKKKQKTSIWRETRFYVTNGSGGSKKLPFIWLDSAIQAWWQQTSYGTSFISGCKNSLHTIRSSELVEKYIITVYGTHRQYVQVWQSEHQVVLKRILLLMAKNFNNYCSLILHYMYSTYQCIDNFKRQKTGTWYFKSVLKIEIRVTKGSSVILLPDFVHRDIQFVYTYKKNVGED
jgi:hypothetical protein